MIKVYYGSKIDAVNWKICTDNVQNKLSYFSSDSTINDVANKLCQFSLFDLQENTSDFIHVVNIDDWDLKDKETQKAIKELHELKVSIIFAIETSSFKNKFFSELEIETIKCTSITRKSKEQMVHYLLDQQKINLDYETEQVLVDLLPDQINFIKNEVKKLKLSGLDKFSVSDIRKIVFDTGDATIFNIIESWLAGNKDQMLERINELLAANYLVMDIIPIFAYTLVQLKFYLLAKIARWSTAEITAKQGLAFWQQNKYANLKPYDKTLVKVNDMLSKLYNFDINIKKQKNIPYSQLIKILFE